MNEETTPPTPSAPSKGRRFRINPVWVLPLLAAIAVSGMLYSSYMQAGPTITLSFEDANGIVAGKTPLRYKGVAIGHVLDIRFDTTVGLVHIECRLNADAHEFAMDGARFWIQYPQIGITGIESLDTLISGPYIAAYPGTGSEQLEFGGQSQRPYTDENTPGLRLQLLSDSVGSARRYSPVIYKGIEVGYIDRVSSPDPAAQIVLDIVIQEEHQHLVRSDSYFWELSGIQIHAELLEGIKIESDSIRSIINGGVRFGSYASSDSDAAQPGQRFQLHHSKEHAQSRKKQIQILFPNGIGLVAGKTKIRHKGVPVGVVTKIALSKNLSQVRIYADLDEPYAALASEGSEFWLVRPEISLSGIKNAETILYGVYIDSRIGSGGERTSFAGLTSIPNTLTFGDGLDIVLQAESLGSISNGAPVFYKQVVVGRITGGSLNADGSGVQIYARIEPRYAPLVRQDSKFWNVSGVSVAAGLGKFKVEFETIESILAGGIAFATPPQKKDSAQLQDGASFELQEKEQSAWNKWNPGIDIQGTPD